jgi:FkbH-like protein
MLSYNKLKKQIKEESSEKTILTKIKIGIVGDAPTQYFKIALKGAGLQNGFGFDVLDADFNQIELQVFDNASELHTFKPQYVVIFETFQKIQQKFYKEEKSKRPNFYNYHLAKVEAMCENIEGKVIYLNIPEFNDGIFGNYANKTSYSLLYQIRKINVGLMDLSQKLGNLFILDSAALFHKFGREASYLRNIYINNGLPYSLDFFAELAKNTTDIIGAVQGKFKKCLILDLDNTTWGGIIGDDGLEKIKVGDIGIGKAFSELQAWAKELKNRGIILAICSKNTKSIAQEPFIKHPEMVLKLDDIAVFIANWENKVDNIKHIQSVLNIGFDSMVFLDDNPFERNMVRSAIPELTVPELPEDPGEYLPYITSLNLFETASHSETDDNRTKQYQEEAKRVVFERTFKNEDEYLQNLEMTCKVSAFDKFSIPRVSQLTQRSNQFNLRTIRYTEEEISKIADDKTYFTFSYSLTDKFGDLGLIAVVMLKDIGNKELFIDTWLMSCRVLKRGMENFTLNTIVDVALEYNFEKLIGEYISTKKNEMVKNHYENLGFELKENLWILHVNNYNTKKVFINKA